MPEGWRRLPLSAVVQIVRDLTYPSQLRPDALVTHYSIPALDATGRPIRQLPNEIASGKFKVTRPSVLVSLLNPRIPRTYLVQGSPDSLCSTEFAVLQPTSDSGLLPEYLLLIASGDDFRREMMMRVAGTTGSRQRVRPDSLRGFELDLPPLADQRRTVDLIGAVDDRANACRHLALGANALYYALLDDVYREASAAGPLMPLGDVASTRLGKMLDSKRLTGDGYPYLANVNVQWDQVRTDGLKAVPLTKRERDELTLVAGDVLVCEGGEAGRSAVLSRDLPGVYFQKAVHRVRCGPLLLPRFLMHFMRYASRNGVLDEFLSALTIQHLTGEKLRRVPVPLPPMGVQERAVATLDAASHLEHAAADGAAATNSARAAMLADLLSGQYLIPASYDHLLDPAA